MIPIWIKINGTSVQVTEPQQIIPLILSTISDLQYWSYESLRNLYIGLIDLLAEFCQYRIVETTGATRGKYTRLRNSFWKALKFTPNNREKMIVKLYDMILSGEGLGNFWTINQK